MDNLEKLNLIDPIKEHIRKGKPFLGICLGLQLLFTESEEFGNREGLGIIPGRVLKFPPEVDYKKLIIPQIGWNTIFSGNKEKSFENTLLSGIDEDEYFYFVHSFYVKPNHVNDVLSNTDYEGHVYCSSIQKDNIVATQFHPEKSGKQGLKIYKNWAEQNNLI
jgi:glutamine amidotransferase